MTDKPKASAETQEYATRGGGAIGTFTVISSVIASLMLLASSRQQDIPLPPQPTRPAAMPDPLAPHQEATPSTSPILNNETIPLEEIDPSQIRGLEETIKELERRREIEREKVLQQILEDEMDWDDAVERGLAV